MTLISYYENYTPAADVMVMAFGILFFMLISVTYISPTKSYVYLKYMMIMDLAAAMVNMSFHVCLNHLDVIPHIIIYILRGAYHFALFSILVLYVLYVKENLQIGYRFYKIYFYLASIGFAAIMVYEIVSMAAGFGFHIDTDNTITSGFPVFPFGYMYFLAIVIVMIVVHGKKIYKRVYYGILSSIGLSLAIMIVQQLCHQSSFTAASFIFPIFARMYLIHSNPYDLKMGSISAKSFEDMVNFYYNKKIPIYMMSLYMHDFEGKGRKYPEKILKIIRQFMSEFFNDPILFQISGGHLIMMVNKKKDPHYKESSQKMLIEFSDVYKENKIDYKIIFSDCYEEISEKSDYINFIKFIQDKIPQNTMIFTNENDVADYMNYKYILAELADIHKRNDIKDDRVLVYFQPVYDLKSDEFNTAEALMRLKLPQLGIVPPDLFIPVAEANNYITTLTRIILYKVCDAVRVLLDEGYRLMRVSVNFSMYDLKSDEFFRSVEGIIKENGIETEKIAIEITESQSDSEFELIKARISELKDSGVKFYLDDFGTGYSNFERIMELPFDIVKFDRSLVIASGNNFKYRTMVAHLANMFNNMDYDILYEGVENYDDETRCVNMHANYLQGFKYSRPIPLEEFRGYLTKEKPQNKKAVPKKKNAKAEKPPQGEGLNE